MSRAAAWRLLATWLAALLCVCAAPAAAAESTIVLFASPPGSHPPLESVLDAARGQLAELGVRLSVAERPRAGELARWSARARELAEASQALGVVWLDSRGSSSLVYLYDARTKRLLSRSITVSGSEAAAGEEVAIVLRSAVGALLEGAEIGMTEVPVPESEPVAPVAPVAPEPLPVAEDEASPPEARPDFGLLALGVAYTATVLGEGDELEGGTRLSFAVRASERWALGAAYELFRARSAGTSDVTTRIERHPAEIFVDYDLLLGALRFGPEAGLVVDAIERSTERAEEPLSAEGPSTRWVWAAALRLRLDYELVHRLRVHSALGAQFLLNPFDQEVEEAAGERETVFSLAGVRPTLEVGLAFGVF